MTVSVAQAACPRYAPGMQGGVLVVDKPGGITSFDVVARVRRLAKTRSVGHTGTLDPFATGVLVVLVGDYTKLQNALMAHDKRYTATIAFGVSTTTDDCDGDVVTRTPSALTEAEVAQALPSFVGAFQQVPPAFSALHVDGERAYHKARRGEALVLPPRPVTVNSLNLLSFDAATQTAVVDVACGKGFYVRALARDLGNKLGVGAHLFALRRTVCGAFSLDDAWPLPHEANAETQQQAQQMLKSGKRACVGLPLVEVDAAARTALMRGQRPATSAETHGTAVACYGEELVALFHVENGVMVVERGLVGQTT